MSQLLPSSLPGNNVRNVSLSADLAAAPILFLGGSLS